MFLIRTAFWLTIIVALIPVNPADLEEGQRPVTTMETLGAAQALVSDLSGFCDRNGVACETGREIFAQMGAKAKTGITYVAAYFDETPQMDASPTAVADTTAAQSDTISTGAIE